MSIPYHGMVWYGMVWYRDHIILFLWDGQGNVLVSWNGMGNFWYMQGIPCYMQGYGKYTIYNSIEESYFI